MNKFKNIDFNELEEFNARGNGLVFMGLSIKDTDKEQLIADMNNFFMEGKEGSIGLLKNGAEIIDIIHIDGNVKGEEGRTDLLLKLNKFDVDPIVRIKRVDNIKWIEDFIENYREDYHTWEVVDEKQAVAEKESAIETTAKKEKQPKIYKLGFVRGIYNRETIVEGTLQELIETHKYTLKVGESWQYERRGNKKINTNPKTFKSLVENLNNALNNATINGHSSDFYFIPREQEVKVTCEEKAQQETKKGRGR